MKEKGKRDVSYRHINQTAAYWSVVAAEECHAADPAVTKKPNQTRARTR